MDLIKGVIIGYCDGFGFLKLDDGGDDLYLSVCQMCCGFDGDKVLVWQSGLDNCGCREVIIVEVLECKIQCLVGCFFKESNIGFVVLENWRISQDVLIFNDDFLKVKNGQFVVVEIVQQFSYCFKVVGCIIEIIGEYMVLGMEIDVVICNYDIFYIWFEEVVVVVEKFGDGVDKKDYENCFDLCKMLFVIIDGEDVKDFDDVVYCEKKCSGGWKLYVVIVDVFYYVYLGDLLDIEVYKCGNLVYFFEYVVLMLLVNLFNGLCFLNLYVDCFVMVCEMSVSVVGNVSCYCFYEGVICFYVCLIYNKVGIMLQEVEFREGQDLCIEYKEVVLYLENLYVLFYVFCGQCIECGVIDFEIIEIKIEFGEDCKIECIVFIECNDVYKIIEECMLVVNVCVVKFLQKYKLLVLYCVYEGLKNEKLENLCIFLKELNILFVVSGDFKLEYYQDVLVKIKDCFDYDLIQMVMLWFMN